ncbi:hypothetical protein UFOVP63_50 [uncultured Caudovirales phage]|uniref:Uncharacterized protein n=1 Tax=uncultured Caudovirales phage TaxID=2100421 RepID=A0A6J5KVV0_9CAUD|nr:hypothetical protein UFOVP63_50 [uncultured Caudovirales phage]
MSWKPEVQTDNNGQWYGNALRFGTYREALDNACDLSLRWFAVREYRATECDDPVNYRWTSHGLKAVEKEDA